MARRTSLSEAFAPPARPEPVPEAAAPDPAPAARPPSRAGLKALTLYVDPAAHRQLRMLAIETNMSAQALLVEAVNDLFQKQGKLGVA